MNRSNVVLSPDHVSFTNSTNASTDIGSQEIDNIHLRFLVRAPVSANFDLKQATKYIILSLPISQFTYRRCKQVNNHNITTNITYNNYY